MNGCQNMTFASFLSIIKRVMTLIQIVVPILLIAFASISLIKLLKNPEEKKERKKIINQFIAAVIVFFIPLFVDVVMSLAGDNNEISSCWNEANEKITINNSYIDDGREKKPIMYDATDYDVGGSVGSIAELSVSLAPYASPDKTIIYAPSNFHHESVSSKCGSYYTPNPWYPPSKVDSKYINFEKVMDAVINNERPGNKAYGSCAQAAGAIIRATVDPDFNTSNPAGQIEYIKQNPEKWSFVGQVKPFGRFDDFCQPGDLLITTEGWEHTMIYVGNDAVRAKFPNSNGNIFQAGYNECNYAKYPKIDYLDSAPVPFNIYRPTGGGNFQHSFVDVNKILSN